MTASTDLDRAYRRARYRVELPSGTIEMRLDEHDPGLAELLQNANAERAAFLTACNPGSLRQPPAGNQAAQAALLDELARRGIATVPGVAVDPDGAWPDEESVLALGIDLSAATTLARRFGQNALVWIDAAAVPALVWVSESRD